ASVSAWGRPPGWVQPRPTITPSFATTAPTAGLGQVRPSPRRPRASASAIQRAASALLLTSVTQCVPLRLLSARPIYVIPRRATPRGFNADQRKRKARAHARRPRHLYRRGAGRRRDPPPRLQERCTDRCRSLRVQSRTGSARPVLVRGKQRALLPSLATLS